MIKVGLVDEWRQGWRWLSVQAAAICAIAPEVYEQVRAMREFIEPSLFHHFMAVLGILTIIARLKKQNPQ